MRRLTSLDGVGTYRRCITEQTHQWQRREENHDRRGKIWRRWRSVLGSLARHKEDKEGTTRGGTKHDRTTRSNNTRTHDTHNKPKNGPRAKAQGMLRFVMVVGVSAFPTRHYYSSLSLFALKHSIASMTRSASAGVLGVLFLPLTLKVLPSITSGGPGEVVSPRGSDWDGHYHRLLHLPLFHQAPPTLYYCPLLALPNKGTLCSTFFSFSFPLWRVSRISDESMISMIPKHTVLYY